MTRRMLARTGLALVALGAGLLAQPSHVGAATASKSAWWSRASDPASAAPPAAAVPGVSAPALPAAPPRPDVPEGSLLVEGTPNGATAVAAITYALLEGESNPILTITPSESSNVPPDAVILACRAAIDWAAPDASPGPWADKPLVDCGRSVSGIIADGTITFPLAPIASGSDLDVVLVPGVTPQSTPAGSIGSSFTLSFDAAEGALLTSTSPTTEGFSSGGSFTPPSSGSFTPPSSGSSFTAPEAPVVQPALEPQEQAPSIPEQPMAAAPAAAAAEDDTAQGVAFIILLIGAALAGLAYVTPERSETGAIGLGRFRREVPTNALQQVAHPVEGGLGRFARPRTGAPPSLS